MPDRNADPHNRGVVPGASAVTVRFRDPVEEAGFTILPNPVLVSPRVTPVGKVTYALLRHYARQSGVAFPGQERLAAQVTCSLPTLLKALRLLQELGLITIERRGQTLTNRYWLERLDGTRLSAVK